MKFLLSIILFWISVFLSSSFAKIINVPEDTSRIQSAISIAETGDTVLVADGIYFENKQKAKGPLKNFLFDWDTVMFDLHVGVLNEGGVDSFFPGIARKSRFRSSKS